MKCDYDDVLVQAIFSMMYRIEPGSRSQSCLLLSFIQKLTTRFGARHCGHHQVNISCKVYSLEPLYYVRTYVINSCVCLTVDCFKSHYSISSKLLRTAVRIVRQDGRCLSAWPVSVGMAGVCQRGRCLLAWTVSVKMACVSQRG